MSNKLGETRQYTVPPELDTSAKQIITTVYQSLKDKGHDPIMQIVGYLLSGDPTYITSYNNARSMIRRLERDEILEELVRSYIDNIDRG